MPFPPDPYVIAGKDQQGNTAYYAVYTGTTSQFLATALSTTNAIVIVDGHSNCGIGPAFPSDNIQHIQDFFNIGDSYTAAWIEELKVEYPNLTVSVTADQLPTDGPITSMLTTSASNSEMANTVTNYYVSVLDHVLKYTNDDGVGNGQTFSLDYEWFATSEGTQKWPYHYFSTVLGQSVPFTIIKAGASDLPTPCYKVFFYNGCYTGRDYIGEFQHGIFFYSTAYGGDDSSTLDFTKGVIGGESWDQINNDINVDAGTFTPSYFNYTH